jgi:hypothetical protein
MPSITRRAALVSAAASTTAVAVPVSAAIATREHASKVIVSEAIELCRRARKAVQVLLEGCEDKAACQEAEKHELEIDRLRIRLATKSPKTLHDVAALAVSASYWAQEEPKELDTGSEESSLILAGDRALPTLVRAVLELAGINPNVLAN